MTPPLRCELISWARFHALARKLACAVRDSSFRPDILVAVERGGYMPARILSDFLDLMDLASFKVEHYHGARKGARAVVRYPLSANLDGRRVLLVDDVSDSGDTFAVALAHLATRGTPAEVRSAVLHHKIVSPYVPDYYAQRVVKWRWLIYPWAIAEDVGGFIRAMRPRPASPAEAARHLLESYGLRLPEAVLRDVWRMTAGRREGPRAVTA